MAEAILQLARLTKSYEGRTVVHELDLSVSRGEIFTLLGPSGAGKSTILKIIVGVVRPDTGTVFLSGRDLATVPAPERGVGMVYQDYALFPRMTAWENVAFPEKARRTRSLRGLLAWSLNRRQRAGVAQKVDDMIARVKLTRHASRRPQELSGGEQQRVALARALISRPELLCLDEPFSSIDQYLRAELQQQLLELQRDFEQTILFVTHDHAEALRISTRIGILRDGYLIQVGTPQQVYEKPATLFVARFFGSENIHPIRPVEAGRQLKTLAGTIFEAACTPDSTHSHLLIRPQDLRFLGNDSGDECSLRGVVTGRVFEGSTSVVGVELPTGETLRVAVKTGSTDTPSVGANTRIGYRREAVILLRGDVVSEARASSTSTVRGDRR